MKTDAQLNVSLLGRFQVTFNYSNLEGLENKKVQELFAYLLIRRHQHTREHLISLLWLDVSKEKARKNLRHALWQLQRAFTSQGKKLADIVHIEGEFVKAVPDDVFFDVAEIELVCKQTRGLQGRDIVDSQFRILHEVIKLYRGELLPGWYQDWCIFERERLQSRYLIIVDKLMEYCESRALYESGLEYGHNILRFDYARERTHRRMMLLYARAGYRTAALRQYELCRRILQDELGVEPAHSTQTLYQQISQDQLAEDFPVSLIGPTSSQLAEIQQSLTELQTQISRCLEAISIPTQ